MFGCCVRTLERKGLSEQRLVLGMQECQLHLPRRKSHRRQRQCCNGSTYCQDDPISCGSQRKTPWVDSACADCPGFLVRALPVPGSRLRLGTPDCALGAWPLGYFLGSAARNSPTTRAKRDAQHKLLQHKRAQTEVHRPVNPPRPMPGKYRIPSGFVRTRSRQLGKHHSSEKYDLLTILMAMVAILIFRKLNLRLHLYCISISSIPTMRSATMDFGH